MGELQGRRVKLFPRPHCPSRLTLFFSFSCIAPSVLCIPSSLPFYMCPFLGLSLSRVLTRSVHALTSLSPLFLSVTEQGSRFTTAPTQEERSEKKIVRSFRNKGRDINSLLFSSEIDFSPPSSPLERKWVFNGGPSISFSLPPPHLDLPSFGSRKYPLN